MDIVKSELVSFESVKDLKPLLSANGPCLSVFVPLRSPGTEGWNPTPKQNALRWKECLQGAADRVAPFGSVGRELLASISNWSAVAPKTVEEGTAREKSIAVFRSADVFQVALLDQVLTNRVVIGPHFHIRPLLTGIVKGRNFYLLGLSQKNARLLRCTLHASEEVPFGPEIKTGFEEWLNLAKPDHRAMDNAMTGPAGGGSGPHALAPKSSAQETKGEDLSHFFKQLDRGVREILRGKTEPLVLCGVEYEIPIYREVNGYPHLASEEVRGAPNSLKSSDMHARALDALARCYNKKVDGVLAEWNHRVGGGASSRLKDIVTAAHDGRVLTLLIPDSAQQQPGLYNQANHIVRARETGSLEDEDLINDAAAQTILHAGNVLVAPQDKMPHGSSLAAIFRY